MRTVLALLGTILALPVLIVFAFCISLFNLADMICDIFTEIRTGEIASYEE